MTAARAAVAVVLASAGACANLPAIDPACGNGVLEPGEDCDTDDAGCVACGWKCSSDSDCADIRSPKDPSVYRCGADTFCHAASGVLGGQASAQPFAAPRFYVADIDRDRYGDAVGIANDAILTRFGDRGGLLQASRETLTPVHGGEPALADVDSDGVLDAIVPARDGFVAYASPARAVTPYAFSYQLEGIRIAPRALFPIDGTHIGVLLDDINNSDHLIGAASTSAIPTRFR
jgi:hypothetical protein